MKVGKFMIFLNQPIRFLDLDQMICIQHNAADVDISVQYNGATNFMIQQPKHDEI